MRETHVMTKFSSDALRDRLEIREAIDNWVLWRDAGDWDRFATVWHSDGWMVATWFQAPAADFIDRSRNAFDAGLRVLHSLGGSSVDVRGSRAIAQTKMEIVQRAPVHGVLVDVACRGRFWDAFEKQDGSWRLLLRRLVYESDRMSPVDPGASVSLDSELLNSYPEGYRHLAYLQTQLGVQVVNNLPGTRGPEIETLREVSARWLEDGRRSVLWSKLSVG
jgi:hypothetical protein